MSTRKQWTEDEDDILLIERLNQKTFKEIAEKLGNRTASACQSRYYVLKERLTKYRFSSRPFYLAAERVFQEPLHKFSETSLEYYCVSFFLKPYFEY